MIRSLLGLMERKHYDRLSIGEIVRNANVGRSTFYAHYHDKDDLLISGFSFFLTAIVRRIILRDDGILEFNTTEPFRHAGGTRRCSGP